MFLAYFVPALIGALATVMATLVGRVLLALSVGFVTYKGISLSIEAIKVSVISSFGGMTGDMASLVGYLWLDKGVSIIFSAITISLTMRFVGGSIKKMVLK